MGSFKGTREACNLTELGDNASAQSAAIEPCQAELRTRNFSY
jgi:hypothetical protein